MLEKFSAKERDLHLDQVRIALKTMYSRLIVDYGGRFAILVSDRQLDVLILFVQDRLKIIVRARTVA